MITSAIMLACVLANGAVHSAPSAPPLALTEQDGEFSLKFHLKAMEDGEGKLTIEQVRDKKLDDRFRPIDGGDPVFGQSKGAYWLKAEIQNSTNQPVIGALEQESPWLDSFDLYVIKPGGGYEPFRAGQKIAFNQRSHPHRSFAFPLEFYPQEAKTIYIRAQAGGPLAMPMTFWRAEAYAKAESGRMFHFGAFFGILGLLILRHAGRSWTARGNENALYLAYLSAGFLFAFSYNGLAAMWLWPGQGWFASISAVTFGILTQICAAQLTRRFLDLGRTMPTADKLLSAWMLAMAAMLVLRVIPLWPAYIDAAALWSLRLFMFPLALAAFMIVMEGRREAARLLAGWMVSGAGAAVGISSTAGFLSYSAVGMRFGEALMLIGAVLAGMAINDKSSSAPSS